MLDVHLREDLRSRGADNAPANVALINRIARNILQDADIESWRGGCRGMRETLCAVARCRACLRITPR